MDRADGTRQQRWFLGLLIFGLPLLLRAQPEAQDVFASFQPASAVTQSRGIYSLWSNPGNLALQPPVDTLRIPSPLLPAETEIVPFLELSLLQPSAAVFSSALDRSELLNMLVAKISTPLTTAEKQRLVQAFVNNGLALSTQMVYGAGWLRLAPHTAVGVAVRERISAYLRFNRFISELSFYGRFHPYFDSIAVIDGDTVGFSTRPHRFSELFAGTILDFVWFREYSAGWGTIVLDDPAFRLSWGMNLKYVQGYAYLEGRVTQQQLRAFSAINPAFGIDYGKAVSPSLLDTNTLVPIGWGLGADAGIQFQFPRLALGITVLDIGFLNWEGNLFTAEDTVLNGLSSSGFRTLNLLEEIPKITGKGNFFKWHGLWRLRSWLPTRLYIGATFALPPAVHRFGFPSASVTLGVPLNKAVGNLPQPFLSAGTVIPLDTWISLYPALSLGGALPRPVLSLFAHIELLNGLLNLRLGTADVLALVLRATPVLSATAAVVDFHIPKLW